MTCGEGHGHLFAIRDQAHGTWYEGYKGTEGVYEVTGSKRPEILFSHFKLREASFCSPDTFNGTNTIQS